MSRKVSSVLAVAALLSNCEAVQLRDLVTFKLPDDSTLVYDNDESDAHPKIELIVSEFGGAPSSKSSGAHKHHHHHDESKAQVKTEHPDKLTELSDAQQRTAAKNDLDALQNNMD
jgi:hypothetical protein